MQLGGKVVLVTGAQQGIGRAMALEFAAAGADVAINWLDDDSAAQSIADEVRAQGRRTLLVQADIGRLEQVQAMVSTTREGDWDFVLDINLKGSCFCAQYVAQAMIAAGQPGSIVNIASGAALRGSPRGVHYAASKGGVLSLTRAMALELAPHRIRVNAIAPGLTDTAQPRYGSSEAEIAEMARAIPLGRMAQPGEIARAAVFLASDNAGFITGQTLHVDGGSYLA